MTSLMIISIFFGGKQLPDFRGDPPMISLPPYELRVESRFSSLFNVSYILAGLTLSTIGIKKFPVPVEWQRITIISILFVSFLSIFYLLQGTNNFIFYSVATFFIIISTLVFYFCSFCNEQEKLILRNGAMKLKSTISAYGLL